ncbi:MAG: 16S rRNA (guanine(527)-N(7))-methyltransferase RsmG [Opitutales bacterium]|nr:16S rRNA (guanine(527)-N(7))-methyltransferase RsmG [Opitutales bacterium]
MTYIDEHFPELLSDQVEKLLKYQKLICEWNDKINLVSRQDIGNFLKRHVAPCLCINRVLSFPVGAQVIDVGTGGGLPGLPLAITNPSAKFYLIDSIGKKIVAVKDMVEKLGLLNVNVEHVRAEQISKKFDYIIARAVTNLPNFLHHIRHLKKDNTRVFYLKGGDFSKELKNISKYRLYNVGEILDDESFSDKVVLEIFNE